MMMKVFISSQDWEWPITYTYHITQLGWTARVPHAGSIVGLNRGLDYQPLFRKRARAPPHERAAEIEPRSIAGSILIGLKSSGRARVKIIPFIP